MVDLAQFWAVVRNTGVWSAICQFLLDLFQCSHAYVSIPFWNRKDPKRTIWLVSFQSAVLFTAGSSCCNYSCWAHLDNVLDAGIFHSHAFGVNDVLFPVAVSWIQWDCNGFQLGVDPFFNCVSPSPFSWLRCSGCSPCTANAAGDGVSHWTVLQIQVIAVEV